ncbi:hypothetical protein Tsubulata_024246 [Turnera subulata]|uniref:Fibronectin type III-like domain-containing protein n=1 Tax=Turnera subulata TaxID=218843 RepID=A0A9Q0J1X9_9ROSI|nr:hypothetical protein Tsubulata_024246 [Turnera subulata]
MTMINNSLLFVYYLAIAFLVNSADANSYSTLGHDDATPNGSNFTFVCDPERASDLVKQMTLSEKVLQLGNTNYGVRRLGLPTYEWWSEALHGVSNVGPGTFFDDLVPGSTSFPTVKPVQLHLMGHCGKLLARAGLTYWSPNINVVRDPHWGRAIETPGEDPFLGGKYAANYVRGLQDVEGTENSTDLNSRPLKVSSCCKHYAAYDVDNWKGVERYSFDARETVAEQDMVVTFLRPFEMCVKEGLDLDCGDYYTKYFQSSVQQGKIREADIDRSLKYLYVVLMRLGFFDGIPQYNSLGKKDVCSEENVELAREAAREGTVLLKNVGETLPLDSHNIKTLAVIRPHANATAAMIGNYAATQAAAKANVTVIVAGIDLSIEAESLDRDDLLLPGNQTQLINQVANAAKGPVVLVLFSAGGLDISFTKNNPRIGAILWVGYPGERVGPAIADVFSGKYNPGGRLPLTWHQASSVDSLGYPGRTYKFFNGSAVFPFGYGLSYTKFNYALKSAVKSKQIKLNKFQHCYSIKYGNDSHNPTCPSIRIDDMDCKDHKIEFEVEVQNTGSRDGSDVVIAYSKPPQGILATHIKQVIGFQRVFVPAGGSKKVRFVLNLCNSLHVVDYNAYTVLPSGGHTITIGEDIVSFPLDVNFSG